MKRLKYILLMILLAVTSMVTAQESYVIDSVCIGADRNYRVEGLVGSTYEWFVTDAVGDTIVESMGVSFEEKTIAGDSIYGTDLQVLWDIPGTYLVTTVQYSIHGCDTTEQGFVKVYEPPFAFAGNPMILCTIDTVKLDEAIAENFSRLTWTTLGDGYFEYDSIINARYIPGINDSISGGVMLIITANGLADNSTCTPAIDSIDVIFSTPIVTFDWRNLLCFNDNSGWIKANVSSGSEPYVYSWTGPNGYTASSDSIYGLAAGEYVLIVTDNYGCSVSDSIIVTQPDELIALINSSQNVTCFGGNDGFASVLVSGGTKDYTYEWNTFPAQDSSVAIDLFAVDYSVTVTDNHGCIATQTITISEPPKLVLSADSVDAICITGGLGSIDLTVNGGTPFKNEPFYLYEWSDASGVIANTEDIIDLPGDVLYTVIVTDSIGCIDTLSVFINEEKDIKLELSSIDSILCYGDSNGKIDITISDGKLPYTILWDSGETSEDLINIPAGSYHVVVFDDNGCKQEMSFTLLNPEELIANITADTEICEDENLLFNGNPVGGTGTYTHLWTGNGTTYLTDLNIVDPEFSGAPAGLYSIIYNVTDENGCVASDTLNLTVNPVTYSTVLDSICMSDLPYFWNDSTYLAAGIYENHKTNVYGCDSVITLNLFIYDEIIIVATPVNEGNFGAADGSIDLAVSGGTAPYDFNWSNGETTEDLTGLVAGDYGVVVTDAKGCSDSLTIKITGKPATVTLDCPPMIELECKEDIDITLPYATFAEFSAAGGTASSSCGIDISTFAYIGENEIAGIFCLNIERTYYIEDSCGNPQECKQLIVVNDLVAPVMSCPQEIIVSGNTKPAPYNSYAAFFSAGGVASDNCEIDEETFRQIGSDVSDGNTNPEVITRTYEISDFCGNTASCEQTITIFDNSGIFLDCPQAITVACIDDVPNAYLDFAEFEAAGGTAGTNPLFPLDYSTFTQIGPDVSDGNSCPETITRTYSIKNDNGEEAICEQLIIIRDVIKPILEFSRKSGNCPEDKPFIYSTRAQFEFYPGNKASDDCELDWSSLRLVTQTKDGTCPETTIRWYEIADLCGNLTQAREIIVIDDQIKPFALRPLKDLTTTCELPKPYQDRQDFESNSGSFIIENCGDYTVKYLGDSVLMGTDCPIILIRKYRFTDRCGNYNDYPQNIYIHDTIPPEISCPVDITYDGGIDDLGDLSGLAYSETETQVPIDDALTFGILATDNCELTAITYVDVLGGICLEEITRTFKVYDKCGNTDECSQKIEITSGIILTETHVNVGTSSLPIGSIDLTVVGGTAPYFYSWRSGETTEDISNLFAGDYTVTVTDKNGCEATLTVTISQTDVVTSKVCPLDIEITCVTDLLVNPPFALYSDYRNGGGLFESNCGLDTATFTLVSQDTLASIFCLTLQRTYSIEDSCGNVITCEHLIAVNDTEPPVIICPPDSAAECLSDLEYNITNVMEFVAVGGSISDNCAIDSASFVFTRSTTRLSNRIELITTFSITDLCGNENSCEHTVILTDTIPPVASCTNLTVFLDSLGTYILTDDDLRIIANGSSDNCTDAEDLIIDVDISEFTCLDVIESGVAVNIIVSDDAGNSSACNATITVIDNLPPVAVCQDVALYLDENGVVTVNLSQIDNGSYDNCKIDTMYIDRDSFDCTDVGDNLVTLVVIDAAGNRDECSANAMVIDSIGPEVICLDKTIILGSDATYELSTQELLFGTYDICGVDTVFLDNYHLDCDNIGTTYITVTAVDINGNSSDCIAELTVFGNVAPNVLNDSAITVMNIPIEIDIITNDYDTKTTLNLETLSIFAQPENGTVELNPVNGNLTYTPNPGFVGEDVLTYTICDDGIPCVPMCGKAQVYITVLEPNIPPVAVDDYFTTTCAHPTGNVLVNDYDPDSDEIRIITTPVTQPANGEVIIYENGDFDYIAYDNYLGLDSFRYEITDLGLPNMRDTATVYLDVLPDNDCDGISDWDDIDDDNDGILDVDEGNTDPNTWIDSDLDGVPDHLDIDSDNDGILDNTEWQEEGVYIPPTGFDTNHNGWDDAYDPEDGGYYQPLADSDDDSIPDHLDLDSDNDHVYDFIEGHDINADGVPDVTRIFIDSDHDGLDDIYDIVYGWNDPIDPYNALGSNAPLQDFDGDGLRDWRDINDEDDEFFTVEEDINNDGDYSNDDLDLDGYPEYLDKTLDCELFIPEGFSPNGDGVHDFFQILCIQRYPNARLLIFNRNGDKLFEKDHYGNLEFWGSNEDAWWWGTTQNTWTIGQTGGLPAGNYVYVLELGNGRVEKSTVMINY